MKPHKVILKIAYSVVGLSVVALIALTVYQQQQIRRMSKTESPAASANIPPAEVQENATVEKTTLRNANPDIDELKYHLDAAEEELDMAHEELASELDRKAEFTKNRIALQRQMLQDPTTKKLLRSASASALDIPYAALFKKLALSPEKQDAFKELLVDLQLDSTDLSMEMLDMSISEEKRAEIRQRLETLQNESDENIRELLGTDNNEKYLTFKERLSESTLVTAFLGSLGPDEKLTDTQQQAFVDSMYEERKKVQSALPRDNKILSPADINETLIARTMETTDQTFLGYTQVAGAYLSSSQVDQFDNFLDQRRNLTEMSLNMTRQMFGNNPVPDQSPEEPEGTAD